MNAERQSPTPAHVNGLTVFPPPPQASIYQQPNTVPHGVAYTVPSSAPQQAHSQPPPQQHPQRGPSVCPPDHDASKGSLAYEYGHLYDAVQHPAPAVPAPHVTAINLPASMVGMIAIDFKNQTPNDSDDSELEASSEPTTLYSSPSLSDSGDLRVEGTMADLPVSFLIDTGASVSVANSGFLKKSPTYSAFQQSPSPYKAINTVSGESLSVEGRVDVPITMGDNTSNWQMLSVPGLQSNAILGKDFLDKHKAVIDFANRTLTLPDSAPIIFNQHGSSVAVLTPATIESDNEAPTSAEPSLSKYSHSNKQRAVTKTITSNSQQDILDGDSEKQAAKYRDKNSSLTRAGAIRSKYQNSANADQPNNEEIKNSLLPEDTPTSNYNPLVLFTSILMLIKWLHSIFEPSKTCHRKSSNIKPQLTCLQIKNTSQPTGDPNDSIPDIHTDPTMPKPQLWTSESDKRNGLVHAIWSRLIPT